MPQVEVHLEVITRYKITVDVPDYSEAGAKQAAYNAGLEEFARGEKGEFTGRHFGHAHVVKWALPPIENQRQVYRNIFQSNFAVYEVQAQEPTYHLICLDDGSYMTDLAEIPTPKRVWELVADIWEIDLNAPNGGGLSYSRHIEGN